MSYFNASYARAVGFIFKFSPTLINPIASLFRTQHNTMPKTMAAAANNNTNIEDTIDSREFIANPRKVIAEKLFSAYGFKSLSAATSSALEPIDGDWNLSKVLKKSISESEEEERDAKKTTKRLSIPEINHADGESVGIESGPEGKLCRFRCVVQDMRDPEYYVGCFKSKRASSGWQTTKFSEHGGDETSRMEEEDEEEGEEKDKNDDDGGHERDEKIRARRGVVVERTRRAVWTVALDESSAMFVY